MSLRQKFVIEVLLLLLIFSFLPFLWRQRSVQHLQKYSQRVEPFIRTIVEMPEEVLDFKGDSSPRIVSPFGIAFREFDPILRRIRFKWALSDDSTAILTLNLSDQNYIHLGGEPSISRNRYVNLPAKIIKDSRTMSVIDTAISDTKGGTVSQKFTDEQDGLLWIQAHAGGTPEHFEYVAWDFGGRKFSYKIDDMFNKFLFVRIVIGQSPSLNPVAFPHPSSFFSIDDRNPNIYNNRFSLLKLLFLIVTPLLLGSFVAYQFAKRRSPTESFIKFNLIFIPALVVFYLIYFFIVRFIRAFLYGLAY